MNNSSSDNYSICDPSNNDPSLDSLFACYDYFVQKNLTSTIFEYILGIGTVILNIQVFRMINAKEKKVVFDKILMFHSIVDFVVGAFDLPFYHVFTMFNYWPLSLELCLLWNSLDSALFSISMLIMLYMAFCRFMSVHQPATYQNNRFVKHPFYMTTSIWIISLIYWGFINCFYIIPDYQYGSCTIGYSPSYTEFIYFFIGVFSPLCGIITLTIYVAYKIAQKQRSKRQKHKKFKKDDTASTTVSPNQAGTNKQTKKTKTQTRLTPEMRLTIIVTVYLIQYAPSCIVSLINFNSIVPAQVASVLYWLTYTASLTDPITILILNPNYKIKDQKK